MSLLSVNDRNGVPVVDSRLIAAELGIEHKNLLETLNKYLDKIEASFGAVAFETREFKTKQGNRSTEKIAYLTEDQSTLLMTFSRNTERVVECKVSLVRAFSKAKQVILNQAQEIEVLRLQLELAKEQKHAADSQQKLLGTVQMLEAVSPGLAPLALGRADAVVERVEVVEKHAVVDDRGRTQAQSIGQSKTTIAKSLGMKKPQDLVKWLESIDRTDLLEDGVAVVSVQFVPQEKIREVRQLWSQRKGDRQKVLGEAG